MVETISALVLRAVANPAEWRAVLGVVMATCGAGRAVLSLRDIDTAGMTFPETAPATLGAPLIVGIAPEFVASYFDRYSALDPWTEIERSIHPHIPYVMSEHLKPAALEATPFYKEWLEPQGIRDCLVAELSLSTRNWLALNLLFDTDNADRLRFALDRLEPLLPILRTGWQLGERLAGLAHGQAAGLGYLETWPLPCLALDQDLVVTRANTAGLAAFADHVPLTAPPAVGAPLKLGPCALRDALHARNRGAAPSGAGGEDRIASLEPGHTLHLSAITTDEDIVGRRHVQYVVIAKPDAPPAMKPARPLRVWEASDLTRAQSAVVKWIAEGGNVPAFARTHKISKKTAYDHLLAARRKLGGISARDIYTGHQSQLMLER